MAALTSLLRLLRSPRLAVGLLSFLALYALGGAWAPWSLPGGAAPPSWAADAGLDHPFSAPPFLAAIALLFASTLACTWGKRARVAAFARGVLPASAVALPSRTGGDVTAFLAAQGFRRRGDTWARHRAGLWGGWVLHVGLLALIAGVLVQQAFYETGHFELTEGETTRLGLEGALVLHEHGLLAPAQPPDIEVRLQAFDPYARQDGFAPDRRSQLVITPAGKEAVVTFLDRADGVRVGVVEFFHGVPTGLAVNLAVEGMGGRSVHLRTDGRMSAAADLVAPGGLRGRFSVTTEQPLDDTGGTGALLITYEEPGRRQLVVRGTPFRFGDREAVVTSVGRWGLYSYVHAPGMSGVFAGFILVLLGCALLMLPAGVARAEGEPGVAARVFVVRGAAALLAEWERSATSGSRAG